MRKGMWSAESGERKARSRVVTQRTARTRSAVCRVATRLRNEGRITSVFICPLTLPSPNRRGGCGEVILPSFQISKSEIRNPKSPRSGISLIEILISMFVLLFGLMGVAAIFPVGNFYVVEGEKYDLGSALVQNGFEEVRARGLLRPEFWHYSDPNGNLAAFNATSTTNPPVEYETSVIQPETINGVANPEQGLFNIDPAGPVGPGHAFVIDPLGTAAGSSLPLPNLDILPYDDSSGSVNVNNPWIAVLSGERWPLRRLTVLDTNGLMSTAVAETIFRLRDDLAVEQPEEDDVPSIQRWNVDGTGALLSRQYQGNYSWLATVVPSDAGALKSLQPEAPMRDPKATYDVSVVVFRGRDETPSASSERLIRAELVSQRELVIYDDTAALVDAAVDDIRPGNWIALTGVHEATGKFMMKWYRLIALDKDTVFDSDANYTVQSEGGSFYLRFAMLAEPSWPLNSFGNLRAVLMPGAISVVTHQMKMQE